MRRIRILLLGGRTPSNGDFRGLAAEAGYDVMRETVTGCEALDFIEKHRPEAVILNIEPDSAGMEIAMSVKRRLPSVAVVLITDRYDEERLLADLKGGANACLSKEVTPEELLDTVRKAVQGEYPITQTILQPAVASRIIAEFANGSRSTRETAHPPARLLPLEAEILWHISNGGSLEQVTREMHISEDTVKQRLYTILGKLVANSRNCSLADAG